MAPGFETLKRASVRPDRTTKQATRKERVLERMTYAIKIVLPELSCPSFGGGGLGLELFVCQWTA